jgi:hypothetical protein
MERKKEFYKRCPTKGCGTICGFYLPLSKIKKDEKQLCPSCGKENKLSKWTGSTRGAYEGQNAMRNGSKFYKGKGLEATSF